MDEEGLRPGPGRLHEVEERLGVGAEHLQSRPFPLGEVPVQANRAQEALLGVGFVEAQGAGPPGPGGEVLHPRHDPPHHGEIPVQVPGSVADGAGSRNLPR